MNIGPAHKCASTSKVTGKEASAAWIAHRVKPMLLKNPTLGAKELCERLINSLSLYHITKSGKEGRS